MCLVRASVLTVLISAGLGIGHGLQWIRTPPRQAVEDILQEDEARAQAAVSAPPSSPAPATLRAERVEDHKSISEREERIQL